MKLQKEIFREEINAKTKKYLAQGKSIRKLNYVPSEEEVKVTSFRKGRREKENSHIILDEIYRN